MRALIVSIKPGKRMNLYCIDIGNDINIRIIVIETKPDYMKYAEIER